MDQRTALITGASSGIGLELARLAAHDRCNLIIVSRDSERLEHVASRTLRTADWNATVIEGEVVDAVSKLKATSGADLLIYGSASLVQTLIAHDLIDEYRLMVHPVVVGKGRHAFRDGIANKNLRLTDAKPLSSGVVVLFYEPVR